MTRGTFQSRLPVSASAHESGQIHFLPIGQHPESSPFMSNSNGDRHIEQLRIRLPDLVAAVSSVEELVAALVAQPEIDHVLTGQDAFAAPIGEREVDFRLHLALEPPRTVELVVRGDLYGKFHIVHLGP